MLYIRSARSKPSPFNTQFHGKPVLLHKKGQDSLSPTTRLHAASIPITDGLDHSDYRVSSESSRECPSLADTVYNRGDTGGTP